MRLFMFFGSTLLTCVLVANGAEAVAHTHRESPPNLRATLDDELSARAAQDRFSGAVLVARDGHTLFRGAFGYADRERRIGARLNTRFRFGSIAKMFTGVAIMQLVQSGRVRLDDPVITYLTDYPNVDTGNVTIHQLLTHTGGTGDIFGPEFQDHRLALRDLADYIELYGTRGTRFTPGSRHEYSNYGYILLGRIIEVVSEMSYDKYVERHIFKPARMHSTGNRPEADLIRNLAIPYTLGPPNREAPDYPSNLRPATDFLPYRGNSAGGGYSTVRDLQLFVEALTSNNLLNSYYTDLYLTGKVSTPKPGTQYAYGVEDGFTINGTRFNGHGGGAPGINASVYFYPSTREVVIVLANLDPPAAEEVHRVIDAALEH